MGLVSIWSSFIVDYISWVLMIFILEFCMIIQRWNRKIWLTVSIAPCFWLKTRILFVPTTIFPLEIISRSKMLQNETNPSSLASSVWKWRSYEGEGLMEYLSNPLNLTILHDFTSFSLGVKLRIGNIQTSFSKNRISWAFRSNFWIKNPVSNYEIVSFFFVTVGVIDPACNPCFIT